MKSLIACLLIGLVVVSGCNPPTPEDTYLSGLEQWRKERLAHLTRPDGWTTLVGLYWLKDSVQTYGSASDNTIVFPEKAPDYIGRFFLSDGGVKGEITTDAPVLLDGKPSKGIVELHTDVEDSTNYYTYQSLQWHIIKRGSQYGIRLKDTLNAARFALRSLPHFPVDKKWIVDAKFTPAAKTDTVHVLNAVGINSALHPEGTLSFEIDGEPYTFIALDGGPDELFVVMGDVTTGDETYGGGRFLDIPRPDSTTGHTVIDFNKAYNPPCVYSEYATCPLPLQENVLPVAVRAGEILD